MDNIIWNANYWSNELMRVTDDIEDMRKKLCEAPIPDLTYEERFKLRETLMHYYSIAKLLRKDLDEHAAQQKIPFYRRIFKK